MDVSTRAPAPDMVLSKSFSTLSGTQKISQEQSLPKFLGIFIWIMWTNTSLHTY